MTHLLPAEIDAMKNCKEINAGAGLLPLVGKLDTNARLPVTLCNAGFVAGTFYIVALAAKSPVGGYIGA